MINQSCPLIESLKLKLSIMKNVLKLPHLIFSFLGMDTNEVLSAIFLEEIRLNGNSANEYGVT